LRLGADKELKRDHETPLYMAVSRGQLKIAKLLIQNQADIDYQKSGYAQDAGSTPLHIAILNGDVKMATLLIKNGANLTLKDKHDKTAFEITPKKHTKEIAELIQKYHRGELSSDKRKTPLLASKVQRANESIAPLAKELKKPENKERVKKQ
ncbi:MAG: ankyrin repeat domain-containing protein, partial [Candidatus Berkiella sp.]